VARDRASIRLDMWADQDWREVSEGAQHLYMLLLSHPTLSYAGVADWKPGRIAAMTHGKTVDAVLADAHELRAKWFILTDPESEEVLVRSFIKHDGILKQPKLTVSMTNAYAAVASRVIREVIAFEVQKLHDRQPELNAWNVKQVETLLRAKGSDIRDLPLGLTPPVTPRFTPAVTPNADQSQGLPTATATTTATEASLPEGNRGGKRPDIRLPADWVPTSAHYERAKSSGVDIVAEVEAFKLHAATHDRHAANWNAAFTTWLTKAKPSAPKPRPKVDWMNP
jgi:hypothetical protein